MIQSSPSIEEIAARIAQSSTIAVVLPDAPEMDIAGLAYALAMGLKKLEKAITVFAPPALATQGLLPWPLTNQDDEPLREFIISFDLTNSPIRELKYERDQNRLNIILSPTKSRLQKEDFEFGYGPLRYELAITLGVPRVEAAAASISRVPELLYEKPIINIDNHPANTRYGELNLIIVPSKEKDSATLPEVIFNLLTALKVPPPDPQSATALLTALRASTRSFRPLKSTANAFALAALLMNHGADSATSERLLTGQRSFSKVKLASRAMVRSRWDQEARILWSLLTKDDFLKTQNSSEELVSIMPMLQEFYPGAEWYVLLWQDPRQEAVRGLVAHDDEARLKALAPHESLDQEGHLWLQMAFQSFAAAEKQISQLLHNQSAVE